MNDEFITPPGHFGFRAKKLFSEEGAALSGGMIAYLQPGGGGPVPPHIHAHDHLFILARGEAVVEFEDGAVSLVVGEPLRVDGRRRHSVWNRGGGEAVMIGLTLENPENPGT